jgi:hypothetical protein
VEVCREVVDDLVFLSSKFVEKLLILFSCFWMFVEVVVDLVFLFLDVRGSCC